MFDSFGIVSFASATKVAGFVQHLRAGRLMGSRCRGCGRTSFPPRADCSACLGGDFEFFELSGRARLHTWTRVVAAPLGFEDRAPYIVGVADLDEGGRILAWMGDSIEESGIEIGMRLEVVPRNSPDGGEGRAYYTLERPGRAREGAADAG